MDYSIIIPVFNKADLTKQCLDALPATIADAGDGEVIVVDNASTDHTTRVLEAYPWIRIIRNERNFGFAGANNQAARVASGDYLVLLNNDTKPWPGWLSSMLTKAREANVGAVGARLLYPDKTCQHGGVVIIGNPFGRQDMAPFHHNFMVPFEEPDVRRTQDFQVVTGACLVTPRKLYAELDGLDEGYWNGFEDVDYCLKVGAKGLRVVYDADAVLYHFESQSGIQRFRKAAWNTELLERRWRGKVRFDALKKNLQRNLLRFPARSARAGINSVILTTPPTNVVVHGTEPPIGRVAFEAAIRRNYAPIGSIYWATGSDSVEVAREAIRVRGIRYCAFVRSETALNEGWLDELLSQVTATPTAVAAAYSPDVPLSENVAFLAGDGRCTVLSLAAIPQHLTLDPFDSIEASVADLLLRLIPNGFGTRGVSKAIAAVPPLPNDAAFIAKYNRSLQSLSDTDPRAVEQVLRQRESHKRSLVSIVTLSWNAPEFTRMALESIARHTSEPYEVIVVDNGSGPETLEFLKSIDDSHVRVIYNPVNRGFGGGNNDGIAQAKGDYIVVLNNDVIVTENWLDALLDPFRRISGVGVTAPRTNKIIGDQEVIDCAYDDLVGMQAYAARRAVRYAKRGYFTDRAIGFCLCIDRRVIDQIGGFDERFVMGNFEDDDFSIRVRAAGYQIYVCDDSFIHHFGSQSFRANNVDYASTMQSNWSRFAEKWGYGRDYPRNGYDPRKAIVRGFDRDLHFAPLPASQSPTAGIANVTSSSPSEAPKIAFVAAVESEESWTQTAEFARRYLQAFVERRDVALHIATIGSPIADTIGRRIFRTLEKLGIAPEDSPDVDISDESDLEKWRDSISADVVMNIADVGDRSPSALRRLVEAVRA